MQQGHLPGVTHGVQAVSQAAHMRTHELSASALTVRRASPKRGTWTQKAHVMAFSALYQARQTPANPIQPIAKVPHNPFFPLPFALLKVNKLVVRAQSL
jgi:hypothetical protein